MDHFCTCGHRINDHGTGKCRWCPCIIPSEAPASVAVGGAIDKAVERLVFMMHIYQGYPVGKSRGPNGCVWEAIKALAPDIATEVEQTDWDTVYNKHWGEADEELIVPASLPDVIAAAQREEDDLPPPHRKQRLAPPDGCKDVEPRIVTAVQKAFAQFVEELRIEVDHTRGYPREALVAVRRCAVLVSHGIAGKPRDIPG